MNLTVLESETVTRVKELKLVGFRVLCPGEQYIAEIPKAAKKLEKRVSEIKHVVDFSTQIGAFVVETNQVEEDGYWICVEVAAYEDIPAGMVTLTIPSQNYAVWSHKDTNTEIRNAYEKLHKWTLENNYQRLMSKWHLEVYKGWNDPEEVEVILLDTVK